MRSSGSGSSSASPSAGWRCRAFRRAQLATAGLYPVASLAAAALAFGGADALHGSGFLAVYIAGLALGTAHVPAKQTIASFHQGLAWVAQLGMFLTLGLLVFPHQLATSRSRARCWRSSPSSSRGRSRSSRRRCSRASAGASGCVLGWAGLRGAVPVVLATFPVIAGVPQAASSSTSSSSPCSSRPSLQGTTFEPLARRWA